MNDEFGTFSYGKKEMDTGVERKTPLTAYRPEPYEQPDYNKGYNTDYTGTAKTETGRVSEQKPAAHTAETEHAPVFAGEPMPAAAYTAEAEPAPAFTGEPQTTNGYVNETKPATGYSARPRTENYGFRGTFPPAMGPVGPTPEDPSAGMQNGMNSVPAQRKPESRQRKQQTKKSGKGRKVLATAGLALVFGVVASGAFIGMNKLFGDKKESTTDIQPSTVQSASADAIGTQATYDGSSGTTSTVSYDVAEIVKKAQPSTVSITTTVTQSYQYYFQQYERQATGAGSGIIIGKNDDVLYIATNYHVIEDAKEINVGFNDGQICKAKVTGYDANADVAVVQVKLSDIPEATANAITIAVTGDSDALQVGEPAIAIGNAMGYGQSVTVGYISALNRSISGNTGSYIQTDAAINPGNSGGALFNAKGEVIGINSIKYVDNKVEGMGFSIPINKAMSIIDGLIQNGTTGRIYSGIGGANVTSEYTQIYGFPIGIYVKNINSDSPAEKAGLHTGDIIYAIDNKPVATMDELTDALQKYKAGDEVELSIYRANNNGQYNRDSVIVTVDHE